MDTRESPHHRSSRGFLIMRPYAPNWYQFCGGNLIEHQREMAALSGKSFLEHSQNFYLALFHVSCSFVETCSRKEINFSGVAM